MDDKLLLSKAISLLYYESKLQDPSINSIDTIRTILESIKVPDNGMGINGDREVIRSLKSSLIEMCGYGPCYEYDLETLLAQFRINCGHDDRLYQIIETALKKNYDESQLKRQITLIRRSVDHYFREQQAGLILERANVDYKFNRDKIGDFSEFLLKIVSQIEPLTMQSAVKDPAIVSEVDIGDDSSMKEAFENVVKSNNGECVYKLGWPEMMDMMQGGPRPGETWIFGGLRHEYKTGFSLSVFAQMAMFNEPETFLKDPAKKPLMLRISFEDEVATNLQFLYTYLKYSETREFVDIKTVSAEEMQAYVSKNMRSKGFHVKMMRVDPHSWTVKAIMNKVIELESQGYEVKVLALDYLYKVPTTGCAIGPAGTDVMDALSRIRNFCSAKGIVCLNPHQLSTEATVLLRSGIPDVTFVKELVGKDFFEGSRGLGRIYDGAVLFHKFKHMKDWYFSVQLDKHRFPCIVEDDKRFFLFKFPKGMPIPHNFNGEYSSSRTLPSGASNVNEELYTF